VNASIPPVGRAPRPAHRLDRASLAAVFAGGVLALAASLPAVWWEALHFDEATTLHFAPESVHDIVHDVFVERGGAPLFFFVEHGSLSWPGGVEGLRLPAVLFFLLALPLAALVGRKLCDDSAGRSLVILLALAPLAVALATFGRMYSLLLVLVLAATALSLRAADRGGIGLWVLAGVVAGGLAYAHPIGPLYGALALATGVIAGWQGIRRSLRTTLAAAAGFLVALAPYSYALAVLQERYRIGESQSSFLPTESGRTVVEESLLALSPWDGPGEGALALLGLVGFIVAARSRPRTALILALWLVLPVAFFSLTPVGSLVFAPRYLLPVLPFFLLAVIAGSVATGSRFGRGPLGALVIVGTIALAEGTDDAARLYRLERVHLREVVTALAPYQETGVLFSSTGARVDDRPPELLDSYIALEASDMRRVRELVGFAPHLRGKPGEGLLGQVRRKGVMELRKFLRTDEPGVGVWVFRGPPERVDLATRGIADIPEVTAVRITPQLLVIRSVDQRTPRRLVELSLRVRSTWPFNPRKDRWVRVLLEMDRRALTAT
jgi:hypothetical protein